MSEPVFHHLVPQWYLRRFADKNKRLRRINTDGSVNEVRRVRDIAGERHFYTFEEEGQPELAFEEALSVLEGSAAEATRRMVASGFPLSERDRDTLAFFFAIQIDRGRYARDWLDHLMDWTFSTLGFGEHEFIEVPEELAVAGDFETDKGKIRISRRTKLDMISARASVVAQSLYKRPWQMVEFNRPVLFTSDQPVGFFEFDRTKASSAFAAQEIRWPVDRNRALILGPEGPGDYTWREGTPGDEHSINGTTADCSYEWTYDHPDGPTRLIYERWITSTTQEERVAQRKQLRNRFPFEEAFPPG